MKAVKFDEPWKVACVEVDKPEPKEGEALIRIVTAGICGSDIHVYHGTHPFTKYPVTQGHEVSGKVAKVGKNVKSVKPGDNRKAYCKCNGVLFR